MPKTTDPREALAAVPDDARRIFVNVTALAIAIEETETRLLTRAKHAEPSGTDLWNARNALQNLTDIPDRYAPCKTLHAALSASDEYRDAAKLIEPIQLAIAELEKAEAIAAAAAAEKESRRLAARDAAEADAIAKVRLQFA
jgi:hypothetical protein